MPQLERYFWFPTHSHTCSCVAAREFHVIHFGPPGTTATRIDQSEVCASTRLRRHCNSVTVEFSVVLRARVRLGVPRVDSRTPPFRPHGSQSMAHDAMASTWSLGCDPEVDSQHDERRFQHRIRKRDPRATKTRARPTSAHDAATLRSPRRREAINAPHARVSCSVHMWFPYK
jgi:hypothetical protein